MSRFVISLGSNVTDSYLRVSQAIRWLRDRFPVNNISEIYKTEAVGSGSGQYSNAVAIIDSEMDTTSLNQLLKEYEIANGRDENSRKSGSVPIDLDIVLENEQILRPWEYSQSFFSIGYDTIK